MTLYSLRHGFITSALYAGIPITSIAAACGTSIAMIEMTYGHQLAERETEIWATLGDDSATLRVAGGRS
ncbi:MAG: hypothetical protein ACU0BB_10690 [Paracoccaceae bacterium]